jgi:GT2 family glycosyltransferase
MRGWKTLFAPGAVVYHHHSASFEHGSPRKLYLVGRNRVRLLAKNATARQLLAASPAILAHELAYLAHTTVRRRTLAPLRGRLRGLREWRQYRRAGAPTRRELDLPRRSWLRSALRRDRAWPGAA